MRPLKAILPLFLIPNLTLSAQPVLISPSTAQSLYDDGVKLKNDKQSGQALLKFKQALELKPDYTDAQYEMAWCQNDTKDYSGAVSNLQKVRQKWTNYAKVYFELGYAYEKLANYDSATANYYKCLSNSSGYSGAYKQLGFVEYQKGNNATALTHFKTYIEISAGKEITDYLFWFRKGFTENATKDYTNAKQSLQKSLQYKTDYINTYLELGFASSRLKQDDEAIGYYNKAIEVDPKSHIPYNGIAEVYRDIKKDINTAMEWYRKTLTINPKERKGNFGMGYCLNYQEKYSEAVNYLKTAIENEKDYVAAHTELGYSYYKLGNYSDALYNLNKSISLNANGVNPHYYAALVYLAQKNKAKAQEMVSSLKRLNSQYADQLQKHVDAL
jgi:tetratricopeptide (TPR) repeat protein